MKILFLTDTLQAGGRERQLVELLHGLEKKNSIESQLVIFSKNIYYSYIENLNIKIHYLERRTKRDPAIFAKFYRIVKNFQPDLIHSWESMCSIYTIPAVRLLDLKVINSIIRNAPSKLPVFKKGWIRSKIIFPFSDVILSNSLAGLRSYNVPQSKACCIYNGFDFSRLKNLHDSNEIRRRFNITTPKVVGMVGRFCDKKDYETFILSALRILKQRNDVTFLTIGDGPTLERCRSMVELKFQDKIKFLGKQANIESLINVFDIGVLATYTEGLSNAIMEYMALTKPVVATDGGGTKELVVDRKTGFLVKPSNVEDMVEKIEYLLNNPEIATSMGNAGKERIIREFSLEKMTNSIVQLYQECLGYVENSNSYHYETNKRKLQNA